MRNGTLSELPPKWLNRIRDGRNGHAAGSNDREGSEQPLDVNAELAEMRPGNVNATQCRAIGILLSQGAGYDEIVGCIVTATMEMAANHYRCRGWTREREYTFVQKALAAILKARCRAHQDTGAAPIWVAEELAEQFEAMCAAGQRPSIVWRSGSGWHLRDMAWSWGTESEQPQPEPDTAKPEPDPTLSAGQRATWPTPYSTEMPPRRLTLFDKHFARGTVTVTAAPGGTGKSDYSLLEAVSMALGRSVLIGEPLPARLRVWVWNAEDDIDEMKRRVRGICDHYAINPEDLLEWLFLDSSDTLPLDLADGNGRGVTIRENAIKAIAGRVRDLKVDVVIFDPLVQMHTLSESDNAALARIMRALRQHIAVPCNCAVELIHHTRKMGKDSDRELAVDDIRGASSIINAARSGRILHPMTPSDAEQYGIEGDDRPSYFRVERAKTNQARRGTVCWIHLIERPIANGEDGQFRKCDTVVVPTLWNPPRLSDKLSPTLVTTIRSEIGRGEYKRAPQAKNAWAGSVIIQCMGLNLDNKGHRRQAKSLLDWLIRNKHLASEFRKDPGGHSREYVVPGSNT